MKRTKLLGAALAILIGGLMVGAALYALAGLWWLLLAGGACLVAGGIMMDVDG